MLLQTSFVQWRPHEIPLLNVFYDLTDHCNLRCRHCFVGGRGQLPDELDTESAVRVVRELAAMHPARVTLTGGEPLLRPDFLEIASCAASFRKKGIGYLKLTTNGTLMTPALAERAAELFDQVNVSIDGLAKNHDYLRGTGTFAKAIRGIRHLVSCGADPKVSITITGQNVEEIPDLLRYLHSDEQVNRVNLRPLWRRGRASSEQSLSPSPAELSALLKALGLPNPESVRASCDVEQGCSFNVKRARCPAGYTMSIDANGDIYPCVFMRDAKHLICNCRGGEIAYHYRSSAIYNSLRESDLTCVLHAGQPTSANVVNTKHHKT